MNIRFRSKPSSFGAIKDYLEYNLEYTDVKISGEADENEIDISINYKTPSGKKQKITYYVSNYPRMQRSLIINKVHAKTDNVEDRDDWANDVIRNLKLNRRLLEHVQLEKASEKVLLGESIKSAGARALLKAVNSSNAGAIIEYFDDERAIELSFYGRQTFRITLKTDISDMMYEIYEGDEVDVEFDSDGLRISDAEDESNRWFFIPKEIKSIEKV